MNPPAAPARLRRLTTLALVFGFGVLFFWLPLEDVTERSVIVIAAGISVLASVALLSRFPFPAIPRGIVFAITGVLAGLAVTPLALFLMALKTGLHGHTVPDFSPSQVLVVIRNTPVWAGAGLLVGLGAGIWPKRR